MLLRNLSARARADIERTNRGEERPERNELAQPADNPPVRDRGNPRSSRAGALDPTQFDSVAEDFFTSIVLGQDRISEPKRYDSGYMHVSELLKGICPRKVRLGDESGEQVFESPTGGHRVMWLIGRAVEKHIRDTYIKAIKGKGVIGVWSCKCGQTSYEGLYQATGRACPFCRVLPNEYSELTLTDHEAGIRGNPDFIVQVGRDGKLRIVEIKSMNSEEYDELLSAKPDHIYQAGSYRRLLIKNGYDVADEVIIVYCTKKFVFGSPYKEFHVDMTNESLNAVLDGVWERAELIRISRTDGTMPARTECANLHSPQAKKCIHVVDCFQRS